MRAYDPAYAYETAVDRARRHASGCTRTAKTAIYYITLDNENYEHARDARGRRRRHHQRHVQALDASTPAAARRRCSSSAAARSCAKRSGRQKILAEKYGVASDVWSVTSYTELRRDAHECERWNMLHPDEAAADSRTSKSSSTRREGPFIAASDYVRVARRADRAVGARATITSLGTDGMGRSETRESLRRHFEVDAECIVVATLYKLMQARQVRRRRASRKRSRTSASTPKSNRRCTRKHIKINHDEYDVSK